jgi:5-methylcytosine-specific restriction endonuclease McrA
MSNKKLVRKNFRDSVFKRDNYKCVTCGCKSDNMDAHHITNRNFMPNGGYVKENGVSLCPECHLKAEKYQDEPLVGFSAEELYRAIKSNYELAYKKSLEDL